MLYEHSETDLSIESDYPKLIRDRIPQVAYRNDGARIPHRVAVDNDEYVRYLQKKVAEESKELVSAEIKSHITEEVADLLEVIDALTNALGISPETVSAVRSEKRTKRGGFDKRLIMTGPPE